MGSTDGTMSTAAGRAESKRRFLAEILNMDKDRGDRCFSILTDEKYARLLREIKAAKNAASKTTLQYRRLKRFDVAVDDGGAEKIVAKSKNDRALLHYLRADEIYDAVESAHVATGHAGRDRLRKETCGRYANVTVSVINLFLSMCETCVAKKTRPRRPEPVPGVCTSRRPPALLFGDRCSVHLIDMRDRPDGDNEFIMVHEDDRTKFVQLRPLRTDGAAEVARNLLDVFLIFGAPCVLYCGDRGRDFTDAVVDRLENRWPELRLINGERVRDGPPAGPRTGGLARDVANMVDSWLRNNGTSKWSDGLPFVQFTKNRTCRLGTQRSPYEAMFGAEPKVGLESALLPAMARAACTVNNGEDLCVFLRRE